MQVEVDHLALADVTHGREAKAVQRMADRFALRIEHAVLQGDKYPSFHCPVCLAHFPSLENGGTKRISAPGGIIPRCWSCPPPGMLRIPTSPRGRKTLPNQHRSSRLALHRFGHDAQTFRHFG